jgi:ribonuclease HI
MDESKLKEQVLDLHTDASVRMAAQRSGIGGWLNTHGDVEDVIYAYSDEVPYEIGINGLEYLALIHGVEAALNLGVRYLYIMTDSELAVKQLIGEYGVYAGHIADRYRRLTGLLSNLPGWEIRHISRVYNSEADILAGAAAGRVDALKKFKYLGDNYVRSINNFAPAGS